MPLPTIPHCDLDPKCCGCLDQVIEGDKTCFRCNECGAIVSKEDVARIVLETKPVMKIPIMAGIKFLHLMGR